MKWAIILGLMIFVSFNLAAANDVGYSYMYSLQKNGDSIRVVEENVGLVVYTGNLESKTHSWQLYDVSGRKLLSSKFGFPEYKFVERDYSCISENLIDNLPGCTPLPGLIKEDESFAYIFVPYHPLGSYISILDSNDVEKLRISVEKYSDYCGNGICSDTESYLTCQNDCDSESMLFISDMNQEFFAYNTVVKSSKNVVVYSSINNCKDVVSDCIEYDEAKNIMNVFVRESSTIEISTDKIFVYNINFLNNGGQLKINSASSLMLVSPGNMKMSFTDWSDMPVVNSNYLEGNLKCSDTFNPSISNQLVRICK